jgi:hypothetical protein
MGTILSFTLCLRKVTSEKKPAFQYLNVGCMFLKILLFLCFHIFKHASIMISTKQGPLNLLLVFFSISGPEPCVQFTCKYIHTLTLKLHSKNKWDQSSKASLQYKTQLWSAVTCQCLLLSIPFVLIRSCNISQAKKLCLEVHLLFHIHWDGKWEGICWKLNLYIWLGTKSPDWLLVISHWSLSSDVTTPLSISFSVPRQLRLIKEDEKLVQDQ